MRKIAFRAWDKEAKKMWWLDYFWNNDWYGQSHSDFKERKNNHGGVLANSNVVMGRKYNLGQIILMQFTGLHDKNGKEIWEGDIVAFVWGKGIIHFESGSFNVLLNSIKALPDGTKRNFVEFKDIQAKMEVIGNIMENPELLNA